MERIFKIFSFTGSKIIEFIYRTDRAVLYSLIGKAWRILFGPISLYLVSLKLTPEEQGYYYLFFSIVGFQAIVEIGFSHTLVQNIAHEMSRVKYFKKNFYGSKQGIERISETLKLGFLWYFILSLVCIFIIYPTGIVIMIDETDFIKTGWFIPWTIFITISALNLTLFPANFFLEGVLRLQNIYKTRLIIQIFGTLIFVTLLLLDFNLLSIIATPLASFLLNLFLNYVPNAKILNTTIFKLPSKSFIHSILKWQIKVGLVWGTGYLYWQLPTIIIFRILGPIISGKYGMSLNLIKSIIDIGNIFVRTKAAEIGKLRNNGHATKAYHMFNVLTKQSYSIVAVGFITFFTLWYLFPDFSVFNRMLSFHQTFWLFVAFLVTLPVLNWAMYARCTKDEPFFNLSMATNFGFWLILLLFLHILGNIWGVIIAFLGVHIIQLIWGYNIFRPIKNNDLT